MSVTWYEPSDTQWKGEVAPRSTMSTPFWSNKIGNGPLYPSLNGGKYLRPLIARNGATVVLTINQYENPYDPPRLTYLSWIESVTFVLRAHDDGPVIRRAACS